MDTGTVRLVIFLGMFLVFAGDYSSLISTIFGTASADKNGTTSLKQRSTLQGSSGPSSSSASSSPSSSSSSSSSSTSSSVSASKKATKDSMIDDDDRYGRSNDHVIIADGNDNHRDNYYDNHDLNKDEQFLEDNAGISTKAKLMSTIKTACLPKLICELTASTNHGQLSDTERSLLNLIRDTSLSTTAEVASRYHFAAHMGQLISGLEGQGCHNFYPTCPFPGSSVLNMMKKVRLR